MFLPAPLRPFPRNTQTLPYYPRPRLVGRCSFQRRNPNRTGLSASLDNPSGANGRGRGRRRRPFPTRGRQYPRASAPGSPRALRPLLGPATITPGVRPSSELRRTGARRHRRSSGRGGARGPRRLERERMAPAGPPRSSRTHRRRCPESLRTLAGGLAPAARPGGRTLEKRRSGRGRPPCPPPLRHSHRASRTPRTAPGPPSIMQPAAGAGAPGCAVATPAPHPPPPPLRPSRSGREIAKDAGRWRLAHLLRERSKLLISIYL